VRVGTPLEDGACLGRTQVADVIFTVATLGFFALAWLYVVACERL